VNGDDGLTRPRAELRPEIDGFLQVKCGHILAGHTGPIDQPIGEPARDRLSHGRLVDVEVTSQSSQAIDDLAEANNVGRRAADRSDSRLGFGVDLGVGSLSPTAQISQISTALSSVIR
jgi:hypothetical protein